MNNYSEDQAIMYKRKLKKPTKPNHSGIIKIVNKILV
jgi:hypothetical protein